MAKHHVTTSINGDPVEFLCDTQETLLDCLRDKLQLTDLLSDAGKIGRRQRIRHEQYLHPPARCLASRRAA